jgi:outer membrane protein
MVFVFSPTEGGHFVGPPCCCSGFFRASSPGRRCRSPCLRKIRLRKMRPRQSRPHKMLRPLLRRKPRQFPHSRRRCTCRITRSRARLFPHLLQPYRPQELAQPNLANSPRIDSLMRDGKIYLSIDDAVALALENNLDIDIARYNLNIADTDYCARNRAPTFSASTPALCRTRPAAVWVAWEERWAPAPEALPSRPAASALAPTAWSVRRSASAQTSPASIPIVTSTLQLDKDDTESTSALSPRAVTGAEHLHRRLRLHAGFRVGHALNAGFNNTHVTTNSPPVC